MNETVTLWRPTGPKELALVEESGWRAWPPRLPEQPIFYPVLNEEYATKIARDWNVPHSGVGYVTRFEVTKSFLDRYDVQQAGGRTILEYWIPAEDLDEFNANIVGLIEVVAEYR
ncbi:MAG TPA: ADP-ribosylation/crystallin J1 [Mycobacteriales bacterium]